MPPEQSSKISIGVTARYSAERSSPAKGLYFFTYTITIENNGPQGARLLSRHWIITDANGKTQEVIGEGVVGKQPHLITGGRFSYTSGTPLETMIGSMHGSYHMVADNGHHFEAPIAPFSLAVPGQLH
ncbi:MAG: Co2+/Mg2+ efflux protein ApaG [Gammaproteobacteria bacterium]|nr:Co2+/Mg2+ efflux protein ApaG [Gammaproteobacteria bacterium]